MKARAVVLTNAIQSDPTEAVPPSSRHRRILPLCVAGWTALAGVSLYFLMRAENTTNTWYLQDGAPLPPLNPGKFNAIFRSEAGFQRVYPWIFFGPYIALLAFFFPLERDRLRLNLLLHILACGAFMALSNVVDERIRAASVKITIIKSTGFHEGTETNAIRVQVINGATGIFESQSITKFQDRVAGRILSSTNGGAPVFTLPTTNFMDEAGRDFLIHPNAGKYPIPRLWPSLLDLMAYGAIAGLAHSIHFYRRLREREHRTLALESNLATARLHALRAQLQPHFLFNSLNAIAALLRRDPRQAETTLMSLSDLLRLALSQSERQEIPLRDEMQFVQRYLEIQQTRFGDKLRVEQEIEPAALDRPVPTLLLQPLVENAIRHGIEPAENAGLVRLTAKQDGDRLVLTVEDDGVGLAGTGGDVFATKVNDINSHTASLAKSESEEGGIGLRNLRARLETLYGARQKLELIPRSGGGLIVRIEIPWLAAPQPEGRAQST